MYRLQREAEVLTPTPGITISGIVITAVLVALIGVLASLDVLRNKPLSTLRAE